MALDFGIRNGLLNRAPCWAFEDWTASALRGGARAEDHEGGDQGDGRGSGPTPSGGEEAFEVGAHTLPEKATGGVPHDFLPLTVMELADKILNEVLGGLLIALQTKQALDVFKVAHRWTVRLRLAGCDY